MRSAWPEVACGLPMLLAAGLLAAGGAGRAHAQGAPARGAPPVVDRREVIVPIPGAERLRVENLLGRVQVRGWAQAGQMRIAADKSGPADVDLDRLRVHTAVKADGEIAIDVRVEVDGRERPMPASGSRVDLLIEIPPELELAAKTFGGDISASGLRAGARLETTGGRIGVSEVSGAVTTHQLRGGQTVVAVEGDVDLDGVDSDIDVERLRGGRILARVVDGHIRADGVLARLVRLESVTGEVVLGGALLPGGMYELRSHGGDVRFIPRALLPSFEIRVPASAAVEGMAGLVAGGEEGGLRIWRRPGRARGTASAGPQRSVLVLASALGRVIIQPVGP